MSTCRKSSREVPEQAANILDDVIGAKALIHDVVDDLAHLFDIRRRTIEDHLRCLGVIDNAAERLFHLVGNGAERRVQRRQLAAALKLQRQVGACETDVLPDRFREQRDQYDCRCAHGKQPACVEAETETARNHKGRHCKFRHQRDHRDRQPKIEDRFLAGVTAAPAAQPH